MTRSIEYYNHINSPEWRKRSRVIRARSGDRCCLFPWKRAVEAHHMVYTPGFKHERYGIECVPLSKEAHDWVHLPQNWKGTRNPRRLRISAYLRVAAWVLFIFGLITFDGKVWIS